MSKGTETTPDQDLGKSDAGESPDGSRNSTVMAELVFENGISIRIPLPSGDSPSIRILVGGTPLELPRIASPNALPEENIFKGFQPPSAKAKPAVMGLMHAPLNQKFDHLVTQVEKALRFDLEIPQALLHDVENINRFMIFTLVNAMIRIGARKAP